MANPRKYHRAEALERLRRFCAYQERYVAECKKKLYTWGYYGLEADEMINELYAENFIDEGRFAEAFVRGKFFHKHWGKQRILYELKQRKISAYNIKKGMAEITDDDYAKAILHLYEKKKKEYSGKGLKEYQLEIKTKNFIVQKGYEYNVVNDVIASDKL